MQFKDAAIDHFIGIDVQVKRGCSYCVLDSQLTCVETGWLKGDSDQICGDLKELLKGISSTGSGEVAVGIDAPRMGLPAPRMNYWRRKEWQRKTSNDKGYGRHCEVVLKALNIANPQWTPLTGDAPDWMKLGFSLFEALEDYELVFEVFPTASYALLKDEKVPKVSIFFANFVDGPKDMLDACISALTVHEFVTGRGSEVGGGDGLGTIIVPTELPVSFSHPVLHWPGTKAHKLGR